MRTRKEIEKDQCRVGRDHELSEFNYREYEQNFETLVLELLLDIRDLLTPQDK